MLYNCLDFISFSQLYFTRITLRLEDILEVALVDSDQWVSMLAELLKTYPSLGRVNFEIEENVSVFTEVANDLRKLGNFFFFFFALYIFLCFCIYLDEMLMVLNQFCMLSVLQDKFLIINIEKLEIAFDCCKDIHSNYLFFSFFKEVPKC